MTIKQTITINSTAANVYKALTTAADFSEITGAPAEIDAAVGGRLSCFGGQITGRIIELVPDERIVQEWRAGPWPSGVHSTVRFDLNADGDVTTIELEQTGYPEGSAAHLEGGWEKMYWEPLKAHFAKAQ